MVNEAVVKETIQRMFDSGIDEQTILSTLKDIGLEDSVARNFIAQQKNAGTATEEKDDINANDEDTNDLKAMRDELESQSQNKELHDTTMHNMLNEHANKLDEVASSIGEIKRTVNDSTSMSGLAMHGVKLSNLEERLDEIDAKVTALLDVMKKILEVNRKTLTELQSK